jgi:hypothetical protein
MEAYPVSVLAQLPPFTSVRGRSCPERARCPASVRTPTDTPSRTWKAGGVGEHFGSQTARPAQHGNGLTRARAANSELTVGTGGPLRTPDRELRIRSSDCDEGALPACCRYPQTQPVRSELIMVGEAAARPQKLQKLGQTVLSLDKPHDDGKVSMTRWNGAFVRTSDDLEGNPGPHS